MLPLALNGCPKCKKSPNLVTLPRTQTHTFRRTKKSRHRQAQNANRRDKMDVDNRRALTPATFFPMLLLLLFLLRPPHPPPIECRISHMRMLNKQPTDDDDCISDCTKIRTLNDDDVVVAAATAKRTKKCSFYHIWLLIYRPTFSASAPALVCDKIDENNCEFFIFCLRRRQKDI